MSEHGLPLKSGEDQWPQHQSLSRAYCAVLVVYVHQCFFASDMGYTELFENVYTNRRLVVGTVGTRKLDVLCSFSQYSGPGGLMSRSKCADFHSAPGPSSAIVMARLRLCSRPRQQRKQCKR